MSKIHLERLIDTIVSTGAVHSVPSNHHVSRREHEISACLKSSDLPGILRISSESFPGRDDLPDISELINVPESPDSKTSHGQGLGGNVREEGTDALAWYRSFHWHSSPPWGIYIRSSGIEYLVSKVFEKLTGKQYQQRDCYQMAFELLFYHEFFHFVTDVGIADFEISSTPPYLQLHARYVRDVYLRPRENYEPLEEALANAFSYAYAERKWSKTGNWNDNLSAGISNFMSNQPRGYSSYVLFVDFRTSFLSGISALGVQIVLGASGNPGVRLTTSIEEISFDWKMRSLHFRDVPLMIVP